MSAQTRCWFCGEHRSPLTDEHVLSEHHFGARLIAPKTICAVCNSASGEVEKLVAGGPWVAEAVGMFRAAAVSRPRAYPRVQGRTSDGATVHVEERGTEVRVVALTPRQIGTDADEAAVWEVEAGTEADFERRQLKKGKRVRAVGRELSSLRVTETRRGIGIETFDAWGRFVAKIVLATSSFVLPESWLDGTDAANLRAFFLRQPYEGSTGLPLHCHEQDRSQEPWSLLHGTHLISLYRSRDRQGTRFLLALFGYLGAQIELPTTECPDDEPTWLVPSDFGAPQRVPRSEFDHAVRALGSRTARGGT